ncbi:NUC121 domain-containing protein, partial [Hygrophoropsis aurantiaca]
MVETRPHHHRATLKQTNKAFKSKHASKSALKDIAKGRIQRHSVKTRSGPSANTAAQARLNRRNTAKQAQAQKRAELIESTRIFNGVDGAPRIVAVVPLCPDVDAQRAVRGLAHELDVDPSGCPETGSWRMPAARFKTSLQFINVAYRNMYAAIDACLAADYVLFVLSAETEVDNWGDVLLRTLQAHALPHVVAAVLPPEHHKKTSPPILKSLLSFVQYFVPANSRVFDLAAPSDRLSVVRALAEGRPDVRSWRDGRPWLLADDLAWIPAEDHLLDSTDDTLGTLAVTGIVRGAPLSANRLVHIPAFGDFQIEK